MHIIFHDESSKKIDGFSTGISVACAAYSLLTGPVGWASAAILLGAMATVGQFAVNQERKKIQDEDRKAYFKQTCQILKEEIKQIYAAIKQEVEYYQYCQRSIIALQNIVPTLDSELEKSRLQLTTKENKTKEEEEILFHLEERHQEGLKKEKTRQLEKENFVSDLVSLDLSEEELLMLKELEEEESALLPASEQQCLLYDSPCLSPSLFKASEQNGSNNETIYDLCQRKARIN